MKKYKLIASFACAAALFSSCNRELTEKLVFDANVDTNTATLNNDTLEVKKGNSVSFKFQGNAQYISFFSGETGSDYKFYNLSEIPANEIETCLLNFDVVPTGAAGSIQNTLSLYVSDISSGRIGSLTDSLKSSADSAQIKAEIWTDLTALCAFPTTTATTKSVSLDMKSFLSKRIVLQFKYQTLSNTTTQPKWEIKNLKYVVKQKGKTAVEIAALNLGFKQFDILHPRKRIAYATTGEGVWSVATATNLTMASSVVNKPINEDYLLSDPVKLNALPNLGVYVKNTTDNTNTYAYTYLNTGIYTATFVASNANFLDSGQQKTTSFIIKVID